MCGNVCVAGTDTCPIECPMCVASQTGGSTACTQAASCNCDGFEYTGEIAPGNTVTFTTFAKVEDPDANGAEVRNVVFHVEKKGVEIGNSGEVAVTSPERTTDANSAVIDRYSANWDYTLPDSTGTGGTDTYRVYAKITCGYKAATATGQSAQPLQQPDKNIFERIIDFFLNFFGVPTAQGAETLVTQIGNRVATVIDPVFEALQPPNWVNKPTPTPDVYETVKLGTFNPLVSPTPTPMVELGCKQVTFTLPK